MLSESRPYLDPASEKRISRVVKLERISRVVKLERGRETMYLFTAQTRLQLRKPSNRRLETLLLLASLALNLPETAPFQASVPWSPAQLGARCLAPLRTVQCQDARRRETLIFLRPAAALARAPDPQVLRAAGNVVGEVEFGEVESNVQLDVLVEDLSLSEEQVAPESIHRLRSCVSVRSGSAVVIAALNDFLPW